MEQWPQGEAVKGDGAGARAASDAAEAEIAISAATPMTEPSRRMRLKSEAARICAFDHAAAVEHVGLGGSSPSAIAGSASVARLSQSSCIGVNRLAADKRGAEHGDSLGRVVDMR